MKRFPLWLLAPAVAIGMTIGVAMGTNPYERRVSLPTAADVSVVTVIPTVSSESIDLAEKKKESSQPILEMETPQTPAPKRPVVKTKKAAVVAERKEATSPASCPEPPLTAMTTKGHEIVVCIADQRVYVQENGEIVKVLKCSTSSGSIKSLDYRGNEPHDHLGEFTILDKTLRRWSKSYSVWMPYALHYYGGHYIHATEPSNYHLLGTPASHGCVRLSETDAAWLYNWARVGDRIVIEAEISG